MAKIVEEVITPAGPATVVTEVVEAVTQKNIFTPKRLIIAGVVVVAAVGTVLIVKKLKDRQAEEDDE